MPQALLARLGEEREPVAPPEVDLAHDEVGLALGEHLERLLGAARRLHDEALLDHPELEHRRLLRVGVDEERCVAVGEEARLELLAEHGVAEDVDQVRIEDGPLVLRERDARLVRARASCETGCAGSA